MSNVSAITGLAGALGRAQFEAQYQVAALKKQQDVAADLGAAALKLIASSIVDPQVGQNLDVYA